MSFVDKGIHVYKYCRYPYPVIFHRVKNRGGIFLIYEALAANSWGIYRSLRYIHEFCVLIDCCSTLGAQCPSAKETSAYSAVRSNSVYIKCIGTHMCTKTYLVFVLFTQKSHFWHHMETLKLGGTILKYVPFLCIFDDVTRTNCFQAHAPAALASLLALVRVQEL